MLNSAKTSVRNELFSQANLISAIRLPNNLFSDNAGTEVGSDLIILQKNLHKTEMSQDERLLTVIQTDTKTNLTDNAYFIHHPERIVHTTAKLDTDLTQARYGLSARGQNRRHRRGFAPYA